MTISKYSLKNKINSLKKRELIISCLLGIVVVYTTSDHYFISKKNQEIKNMQAMILEKNSELTLLETKLNSAASEKPQINIYEKNLKEVEEKLNSKKNEKLALQKTFLSSKEIAGWLKDIANNDQTIKIKSLVVHPSQIILGEEKEDTNTKKKDSALIKLYKHPIEIVIEGNYENIVKYLFKLNETTKKIYWNNIELKAISPPTSSVSIRIYTISQDESWLSL